MIGTRMSTRIQAMVLNGERFSRIIIIATGIAVKRKTNENICQKMLQFIA
jgi:hypothetical protein